MGPRSWAALWVAGAAACGGETSVPFGNPGCCYYRCVGPRVQVFSAFFVDGQDCEDTGRLRCEEFFGPLLDDPDQDLPADATELEASTFVALSEEEVGSDITRTCEQVEPPAGFEPEP